MGGDIGSPRIEGVNLFPNEAKEERDEFLDGSLKFNGGGFWKRLNRDLVDVGEVGSFSRSCSGGGDGRSPDPWYDCFPPNRKC